MKKKNPNYLQIWSDCKIYKPQGETFVFLKPLWTWFPWNFSCFTIMYSFKGKIQFLYDFWYIKEGECSAKICMSYRDRHGLCLPALAQTGTPTLCLMDQQMNHGLFHSAPRILFLPSWRKCEKVQQSSCLITRSLAALIEDGVICVDGVYFWISCDICLLNSLGIITQKEQKFWLAQACAVQSVTRTFL